MDTVTVSRAGEYIMVVSTEPSGVTEILLLTPAEAQEAAKEMSIMASIITLDTTARLRYDSKVKGIEKGRDVSLTHEELVAAGVEWNGKVWDD